MVQRLLALSASLIFSLCAAWAEAGFSTSIMRPTAVGANGVISASFPTGGQKVSYYFSARVQKGELLTQIAFDGREGTPKQVELALLSGNARVEDSYWIHGSEEKTESTRSFPIDADGTRILRVTVQGPETGGFRVELGGSAFLESTSPPAAAREHSPETALLSSKSPETRAALVSPPVQSLALSTTAQNPTPIVASGVVSAPFPATKTYYYFIADVQPGALLTQISYQGRKDASKELELALLNNDGKAEEWYWIHGGDPTDEATRSFSIENPGQRLLRVAAQGPETGQFRVEFGGSALRGVEPKTPLLHNGFSRSVFAPTPVDESGVITGSLPGAEAKLVYYFVIDAQVGDLLTQISYEGRAGAPKALTLNLLSDDARVAQWFWIHGSDAQEEATRGFPIDAAGRKLLRVEVAGPATGSFRIELGGTALTHQAETAKPPLRTSQSAL
jgi:hypothetical protein